MDTNKATSSSAKDADVTAIVKQMSMAFRNLRTYQLNNPILQKSLEVLCTKLSSFLDVNGSLTLLVKEHDLVYGSSVVYSCDDKMESLAFSLFKDGIRLLTFRDGLPPRELHSFMHALNDARDADPYQADVVTILWEKDLSFITYRAVDAYLEDDEKRRIEELVQKCSDQPASATQGDTLPGADFFLKELGISPAQKQRRHQRKLLRESDVRRIAREILDEEDRAILRRCSDICLEILNLGPRDDTFNRVVNFLGRICDWLVSSEDFLSACTIVSDIRSLADREDIGETARSSIRDTIARLGEAQRIRYIGEQLKGVPEQRAEEIFAYLALMAPVAVRPLCEILAECEIRKIRYLLCRALSVIAKSEPERLRPFMQDKRWFFVRNTVMILGMTGNVKGIALLRLAANHSEDRVRREVARSLGRIKSAEGLELLEPLLTDGNKMVRIATLTAMREIADARARDLLEPLLADSSFNKKSADEKREMMRTYGSLGPEGLEFLEAVVDGHFSHMDETSRASAVYGMAMMKTNEATRILADLATSGEGPIRYAAAEAVTTLEP